MRPIPPAMREELDALPRMHRCERFSEECQGRITWEHVWIYGGRQINEIWAIIGLCEYHHLGKGLNKEMNQWISLKYATAEMLKKYPRRAWEQIRSFLNKKYNK